MFAISYIEVDIMCMLILILILRRHVRFFNHSISSRLFTAIVSVLIVFALLDMIGGAAQDESIHLNKYVSEIINSGYFCLIFTASFLSFLYGQYDLGLTWINDKKKKILSITPGIILVLLSIITLKYKFFFYITEEGKYVRGSLYLPFITLGYIYLFILGIQCAVMLSNKKYFAKKSQLIALISYILWVMVGGALQTFFPGPAIICIGITIAMLQLYFNNQSIKITVDPLTQISNRVKLTQYLETKMQTRYRDDKEIVCLMMMDLDRFKDINDNFGHLEGDVALVKFANVLKKVFGSKSALISRYGGDEFCVVFNTDHIKELYEAIKEINTLLAEVNKSNEKGYEIKTSIGWAILSDDISSIPEFIKKADMELYIAKNKK